jgi:hypothetical protein
MFVLNHCFEIFSGSAGREWGSAGGDGPTAVPILVAFPPEFIGRSRLSLSLNLNDGIVTIAARRVNRKLKGGCRRG